MAIYISKQSGLWSSASTWLTGMPSSNFSTTGSITAIGDSSLPPQSGAFDKIIIRGAGTVVEYDTNGMFGDGTSTFSTAIDSDVRLLSNAIVLSGGTLKGSRTQSTSLTANGAIVMNFYDTAWFDWGTTSDPISAVSSTIVFGSPTDATALKCGIYTRNSVTADYPGYGRLESNRVTIVGNTKTRNARLDRFHSTGTSTLSVLDCTNWQVGDRIVVEVPVLQTSQPANTVGSITNINGNVVTINTTLNRDCPSGTYVGNFSSNITFRPGMSAITTPGTNGNAFGIQINPGGNNSLYELKNFSMTDFSGTPGGGACINFGTTYARRNVEIENISIFGTGNLIYGFTWAGGTGFQHTIKNVAYYATNGNSYLFTTGLAAVVSFSDIVGYRSGYIGNSVNSLEVNLNNLRAYAFINAFGAQYYPLKVNFNNCYIRHGAPANPYIFSASWYNQKITFNNCYFQGLNSGGGPSPFVGTSESSTGIYETRNCTFSSISLPVGFLTSSKAFALNYYSLNQNPVDNRRYSSWYALSGNYSMRNRGIASYELGALKLNLPFYFSENIPARANIPQRFIGYLRYQSSYGNTDLPYIKFTDETNTSTVTQIFSCSPTPDVWQKFDLTVTPVADGNLVMTVNAQTSSSSARMYFDGIAFDPINPKARHYGFEFNDTLPYQTVNTLTTLTENQVSAISTINNLDHLYDASNYWSVTNPSLTSYTDLHTRDGNILDFGSRNIVFDNSAGTALSYASSPNTVTIKTPLLSSGNNFIGLRTTGNIYLSSGSTIGEIDIYGNVFQATPVSLSGIYMEGTLAYNTNSNTTIEYTDCTMDTVQNDGSGIVTIKKTNSTIANGLDAEIADFVPTILNVTLNNGYIAIYDNTGTRQYYQNTDGAIVLPSSATGNWTYRIARYGYQYIQGSFTVDPNTGANITISPTYTPDNFVTSNTTAVAAYTDLETTEKIYNYLNYWSTTSSGIDYTPFYSKAFGSITINKNVNLDATAASILTYNGSTLLTLKCSGLAEDVLFVSTGNVVAQNGTTYSDDVKIRATNLNSELILGGITSMTLFPTQNDRDDNTNEGDTLTGTIYRFLYGSVVNGVTLSGTIYARVDVAGTVLLYSDTISTGGNILEFGTTGTLQQIINNQKVINEGVQKASILVPHTTNI